MLTFWRWGCETTLKQFKRTPTNHRVPHSHVLNISEETWERMSTQLCVNAHSIYSCNSCKPDTTSYRSASEGVNTLICMTLQYEGMNYWWCSSAPTNLQRVTLYNRNQTEYPLCHPMGENPSSCKSPTETGSRLATAWGLNGKRTRGRNYKRLQKLWICLSPWLNWCFHHHLLYETVNIGVRDMSQWLRVLAAQLWRPSSDPWKLQKKLLLF